MLSDDTNMICQKVRQSLKDMDAELKQKAQYDEAILQTCAGNGSLSPACPPACPPAVLGPDPLPRALSRRGVPAAAVLLVACARTLS